MSVAALRVVVLGCGTVGAEVVAALCDAERNAALAEAAGVALELVGVAVRRPGIDRPGIDASLVSTDAASLLASSRPDVVIELIGGGDETLSLLEAAIDAGASVITANKRLLATHLASLSARAEARGVGLSFEAAIAGAVPIVRTLRDALAGQRVERVLGIVNGTTNFILSTMSKEQRAYGDVLADAQTRGFAERDPTADVDGHDAAQKAALLASLAFAVAVVDADVPREGISQVILDDLDAARRMGYCVRLLAIAERVDGHSVSVRVRPSMVPLDHPLASVDGALNAVFVEGPGIDALMLLGPGAGGPPTASAVLGDLVSVARLHVSGAVAHAPALDGTLDLLSPGAVVSAFYLSLQVADRPGVLAAVATVFGRHGVSIRSMEQIGLGDDARLIFLTHHATEFDLAATIDELRDLDAVEAIGALLRVVEDTPR